MKLLRLALQNFRGVPDGEYSFADPHTGAPLSTVLVTGGPASGKTSFLEAIAVLKETVGGYGAPPDARRLVRYGRAAGRIEGTWLLTPEEQRRGGLGESTWPTEMGLGDRAGHVERDDKLARLLSQYFREATHGKVEYVPSRRRVATPGRAAAPPISEQAEGRQRPARDPGKYAPLLAWLTESARGNLAELGQIVEQRGVVRRAALPDSLAPVKRAIADLAPHLRLLGLDSGDSAAGLAFARATGERLSFEELSDSEHQAVLFAALFARVGLGHSIVLLDTPELFIHPTAQARFFQSILALGEDNQVFAATSSSALLDQAVPRQIIRLSSPTEGA
jgi:hypothetical protein